MNFNTKIQAAEWANSLGVILFLLYGLVWLIFAIGIWSDAAKLEAAGVRLRFVGSFWWFLITLLFNVPAAALYWAVHHSTLAGGLDGTPAVTPGPKPQPPEVDAGPEPQPPADEPKTKPVEWWKDKV